MNNRTWPIAILICALSGNIWAAEREWTIAKHLEVARQPSLDSLLQNSTEFYRFIHYDPGITSSEIVLVCKGTNGIELTACAVSLHGYYEGAKATYGEQTRILSDAEWSTIKDKMALRVFVWAIIWIHDTHQYAGVQDVAPKSE